MIETNPLTFAIGDVVKFNPESEYCQKHNSDEFDTEQIITDTAFSCRGEDPMDYGVSRCYWYSTADLLFVRKADHASMSKLLTLFQDADEEDFEEEQKKLY